MPIRSCSSATGTTWRGDTAHRSPTAMIVASPTRDGHPSVRVVLLRGVDARGFVFYTNYDSRKGTRARANPHAAVAVPLARAPPSGARDRPGRARRGRRGRTPTGSAAHGQPGRAPGRRTRASRSRSRDELEARPPRSSDASPTRTSPVRVDGAATASSRRGRVLAAPRRPSARPRRATRVSPTTRGASTGSSRDHSSGIASAHERSDREPGNRRAAKRFRP